MGLALWVVPVLNPDGANALDGSGNAIATYTHNGTAIAGGSDLLSGMFFAPVHYLQPVSRDFFAVFTR